MSLLVDLQDAIKTQLETDAMFDPTKASFVPVVSLSQGDMTERIEAAISKRGATVIVLTPGKTRTNREVQTVRVLVHIIEQFTLNRTANGTGQPIEDIAETVEEALDKWTNSPWGEMQIVSSQMLTIPNLLSQKPIEWQVALDLTLIT